MCRTYGAKKKHLKEINFSVLSLASLLGEFLLTLNFFTQTFTNINIA